MPESLPETICCQSGIGHLGQTTQRSKQFRPFVTEWRKFFPSGGREPITAAATAVGAGFPTTANPATLLHAVEHGIQGGEAEAQRAFGLFLNAAGHFIAVKWPVFQDTENGEFGSALLDASADHKSLPYM